jgi:hypothetical protein
LRISLGLLPTALQSPATIRIGENSPFARNLQTHLCRFVVIEDTIYNGRNPKDALVMSLRGQDPIHPQPVDHLNCAYLLFVADIDAVMEEGDPLPATLDDRQQGKVRDAWAKRLWDRMEPELRAAYENCVGFDGVETGDDFARYLKRCQVDTTMPFHDYWTSAPKLSPLPIKPLAAVAIVPLAVTVLAFLSQLFGYMTPLAGWIALGGLGISVVVLFGLYRYIVARGQRPMPPAAYGDLPNVLKSLYLQQHFADFVVDRQSVDANTLHAAFGDFLAAHKPDDKLSPTQTPGVISARHGTF